MAALGLDLRLHPGVCFFRVQVQGRQAWQDWKGLRVPVVSVVPVVRCVQSSTVSVSRMRRGWGWWGWSLSKMSIVGVQMQHPNGKPILNVNSHSNSVAQWIHNHVKIDTGHAFQWYARSPQRGVQNSEPCLCMSNGGQLKGCFSRLKQRSMCFGVGSVFKSVESNDKVHRQATMFCGRG